MPLAAKTGPFFPLMRRVVVMLFVQLARNGKLKTSLIFPAEVIKVNFYLNLILRGG
jgi:hypothetical protein